MSQVPSSDNIEWFRYPFVAVHDQARTWLTTETLQGKDMDEHYLISSNSACFTLPDPSSKIRCVSEKSFVLLFFISFRKWSE